MVQSPAQPQFSSNPYQSPSGTAFDGPIPYGSAAMAGPIVPTRVEIGDLMSRTWEIYKQNFWMCAAAPLIVFILLQLIEQPIGFVTNLQLRGQPPAIFATAQVCLFFFNLTFQAWFTGGLMAYFLEIARGQNPSIGRMFGCRGKYLWILAFQLLFSIGTFVSLFGLIVGAFVFQAIFGFGYFLIMDGRGGPIEAFKLSYSISWPNLGTNLLAMLVAMAVKLPRPVCLLLRGAVRLGLYRCACCHGLPDDVGPAGRRRIRDGSHDHAPHLWRQSVCPNLTLQFGSPRSIQ